MSFSYIKGKCKDINDKLAHFAADHIPFWTEDNKDNCYIIALIKDGGDFYFGGINARTLRPVYILYESDITEILEYSAKEVSNRMFEIQIKEQIQNFPSLLSEIIISNEVLYIKLLKH